MRRLIVKTCSVGLALSLAAGGHSAMAQESAPPATVIHPATPGMTAAAPPVYYGLPPQERAEWLAECHRRLGWRMPPRSWHSSRWAREHEIAYAEDVCANYLDSYYAYYAHYARYMQQVAANLIHSVSLP